MRGKRLWRQLFLSYLWILIAALLLMGWYGSEVVQQFYRDHLTADLEARARLCSRPIAEMLAQRRAGEVDALCKELGQSSSTRITVVLPSGRVIGDSQEDPRGMDNHRQRPEILGALAGSTASSIRYSSTQQQERMYVAVPLELDGALAAVVRTSVPVTAVTQTLRVVRHRLLAAGLVGTALLAAVSLAVSRRLSRPLENIKAGAARFAAGELNYRLPNEGSVEVSTVAEAMNRMAEQLEERIRTIMRQQDEREAMLSSMEEGVLAIDNAGRILSFNGACARLLGEDPEKLRGRTVYEAIRKPDLLTFVEAALASPSPIDHEIPIRGTQDRWLSAHGTALHDSQLGRIGVLIVLHDITRLRHLESVRQDFVANVSHELRTPITSIKGFIETLLEGAMEDRETTTRFLRIMLRQANRLDAILSDLLSLARIEKGAEEHRIELAVEPIRGVLAAAVETCQQKAADKQIAVHWTCPEDLVGPINAALLEQAVVNLLDNAIKYSDPGSSIELSAAAEETHLVIRVEDHGCGIEAKHLPRLFERFYRVDKARSRQLGGTGLGLAIVKHIALAHHGSVHVESTLGVGSVFCLRLPLAQSEMQPTVQNEQDR